jgi:hypothetical protein
MDRHEVETNLKMAAYLHLVSTINHRLEFDIKRNTGWFFRNQIIFPAGLI